MVEIEGQSPVTLSAGDLFVVPTGVRHRPVAESPAHVLMIERPETTQYDT
ncbi:cupin domain-containing protein [Catenulispora pinisilvae]